MPPRCRAGCPPTPGCQRSSRLPGPAVLCPQGSRRWAGGRAGASAFSAACCSCPCCKVSARPALPAPGFGGDGAALPLPPGSRRPPRCPSAGEEEIGCTSGWVPFDGRCYGFFPQELSWRRAESFCQRLGARTHLVSIHNEEEHQAIISMLASSQPYSDSEEQEANGDVWIGLRLSLVSACRRPRPGHGEPHRRGPLLPAPRPGTGAPSPPAPQRRLWEWSDGTKLDYGSWYRDVLPRRRACAALEDTADFASWDVELCSDRKPFICAYRT
ncbi:dromaiocalcin-2 [Dromaius novaehollandiae]|uniref:dromaiocalcin-2 n=1 Tax=Dromaius novaehollandiae TaxID=8790 RepID=UPI00311FF561